MWQLLDAIRRCAEKQSITQSIAQSLAHPAWDVDNNNNPLHNAAQFITESLLKGQVRGQEGVLVLVQSATDNDRDDAGLIQETLTALTGTLAIAAVTAPATSTVSSGLGKSVLTQY